MGCSTNDHRIGRGEPLDPSRDVGRVSQSQLFPSLPSTHLTHDNDTRVDPEADGQLDRLLPFEAGIQGPDGFHHLQPGADRPLRIVLVSLGIAKVDQEAIAQVLGDMPLKAGDHLGAGLPISSGSALHIMLAKRFRVTVDQQCLPLVGRSTENHGHQRNVPKVGRVPVSCG
jgi:hypothetical protein